MRADKYLAFALAYHEPLSDARTPLAAFFRILLEASGGTGGFDTVFQPGREVRGYL